MVILTKQIILTWFDNYDKWVHQAERAERLDVDWEQEDKLLGVTYSSIAELDGKAEEMRAILNNHTILAENEVLAREEARLWKEKYDAEMKKRGAK